MPFAGWEMPVQYTGVSDEHMAVRERAGVFDVSHMGEVLIEGSSALATVQNLTSNDASKLAVGQIQYSGLTTPRGAFVDDVLVARLEEDRFLLTVNASNQEKDVRWIEDNARGASIRDLSDEYALLAVQGPHAAAIVQSLTDADLSKVRYYWFARGTVAGVPAILARTGYTGEDGFELYLSPSDAPRVWDALMEAGGPKGLVPTGLGSRDTLRLEAKMALYGNDIDETTTVLEADLLFILKLNKGEFIGRDALVEQQREGIPRRLVGFELRGAGIARHGHEIVVDGRNAGAVTSGTQTPFLKKSLGLAYLPVGHDKPGSRFDIMIRGRAVPAEVVPTPFYKRTK